MIADRLLPWFDRHGRHDLPWQKPRTPYRVWISEIMLQQTRLATVIPYFERFMQAFPSLPDLAAAEEDAVLAQWSGLGYYRRARFAHRAADACVARHGGKLPVDFDALLALPGIGRSTAGAIMAQAHHQRFPILDGNVKRVLTRFHGIHGNPERSDISKQLWDLAEQHTPRQRIAAYTQAIMDLGATVCTRHAPACRQCPLADDCAARRDGLTAELPTRRPARKLPTRHTAMLILRDPKGRILLTRRGPQGVWAGLWSLPEASHTDASREADRLVKVDDARTFDVFTHTFSHYRLKITPILFDRARRRPRIGDNDRLRWCGPEQWSKLGLPAPVRTLLDSLPDPETRP